MAMTAVANGIVMMIGIVMMTGGHDDWRRDDRRDDRCDDRRRDDRRRDDRRVMTGAVMIDTMIGAVMIGVMMSRAMMTGAMIGVAMIRAVTRVVGAMGATAPLPLLLMYAIRYARFMATLLVTTGGVMVMILMMKWIQMSWRCMLLPMALTPTGTLIPGRQTTSLELSTSSPSTTSTTDVTVCTLQTATVCTHQPHWSFSIAYT
jgi:hypothetical protein